MYNLLKLISVYTVKMSLGSFISSCCFKLFQCGVFIKLSFSCWIALTHLLKIIWKFMCRYIFRLYYVPVVCLLYINIILSWLLLLYSEFWNQIKHAFQIHSFFFFLLTFIEHLLFVRPGCSKPFIRIIQFCPHTLMQIVFPWQTKNRMRTI